MERAVTGDPPRAGDRAFARIPCSLSGLLLIRFVGPGLGQFPFRLVIEFLVLAVRLSGLLPKLIGAADDLDHRWLAHGRSPVIPAVGFAQQR
jgi:hypothetical protein